MRILRRLIDRFFRKPPAQKKSEPDRQSFDLTRRDFGKTTTVGAVVIPALALKAPILQIVQAAGTLLVRTGAGIGENALLADLAEWALNSYAPETLVNIPRSGFPPYTKKTFMHRPMINGFPMKELSKLESMIGILEKAARGENVLSEGHFPQERIASPDACGYPNNYGHVADCPYCLGQWAVGWFEMIPQYKKTVELLSKSISELKKQMPILTKEEILRNIRDFPLTHKKNRSFVVWGTRGGYHEPVHIDKCLKELETYTNNISIEELRKNLADILDSQLESFKKWVEEISSHLKRLEKLPELLNRVEPFATAQDMRTLESIEDTIKSDLKRSLRGASGRFIYFQHCFSDSVDDYELVEQVVESDFELRSKLKVEIVREDGIISTKEILETLTDLPSVFDSGLEQIESISEKLTRKAEEMLEIVSLTDPLSDFLDFSSSNELVISSRELLMAIKIAIEHAKQFPQEKLGITYHGFHINSPEFARFYAGEIYLLSLVAEELWLSTGTQVSFMYSFDASRNGFEKKPKRHTFSNYICEWAQRGEVGVNVVHPNLLIEDGFRQRLEIKYKPLPLQTIVEGLQKDFAELQPM